MPASYAYYSAKNEINSPIPEAAVIVPSDTEDLFVVYRSIYVGNDNGAGSSDVRLITDGGTTLTFKNVPHGKILPITAKRILATGTTATLILGLGQGIPGFVLSPNGFPAQLDIDFVNNQAWDGNQIVSPSSLLTCTRASSGYYQNANGTLTNFPLSNTLRTGSNGLLVEEARTNICLQSQTLDNASWNKINSSVVADAIAAPDGIQTADKLIEDSTLAANHLTYQDITILNATAYAWSVYAKAGTRNFLAFNAYDGADHVTWFDLVNGVVGTNAGGNTSSIRALANGWYYCTITRTSGNVTGRVQLELAPSDNVRSYDGDGSSFIYLWGAQLEQASFSTSYIPTTTTSATRAADNITMSTGFFYNSSTSTLYSQAAIPPDNANYKFLLRLLNNGTPAQRLALAENTGVRTYAAFSPTQELDDTHAVSSGIIKVALAIANNDAALSVQGFAPSTTAVWTLPTGIDTLQIGEDTTDSGRTWNNYIKRIAYWTSRLPNAVLQTLTT